MDGQGDAAAPWPDALPRWNQKTPPGCVPQPTEVQPLSISPLTPSHVSHPRAFTVNNDNCSSVQENLCRPCCRCQLARTGERCTTTYRWWSSSWDEATWSGSGGIQWYLIGL